MGADNNDDYDELQLRHMRLELKNNGCSSFPQGWHSFLGRLSWISAYIFKSEEVGASVWQLLSTIPWASGKGKEGFVIGKLYLKVFD